MADKENKEAEDAKKEDAAATEKKAAPKKAAKKDVEPKKEEAVKDLKDLGEAVQDAKAEEAAAEKLEAIIAPATAEEPIKREKKVDDQGRAYATGRRKDAVARVWVKPGSGKVIVNGRDQGVYFARQTQRLVLNQPFLIVGAVGKYDVMCTVKGGGLSGQAGAVRHGISRALENYDPDLRPALKKAGMLTRDDRIVERKKVGKHKARRSKQWAKR